MLIIIVGSILFVVVLCTILFAFKGKTLKPIPVLNDFPFKYKYGAHGGVYFEVEGFKFGCATENGVRPDGTWGLQSIKFGGVNDHKEHKWKFILKVGDDVFKLLNGYDTLKEELKKRKIELHTESDFDEKIKELTEKIDNLDLIKRVHKERVHNEKEK